jgi:hypothetical protein
MSTNTNRHAFVDFTAKPYIYYHGVPYKIQQNIVPINYGQSGRTIIRSNQPNRAVTNSVSVNGMDDIKNYQNQFPSNYDDSWSNFVRKDNIYTRYACDC